MPPHDDSLKQHIKKVEEILHENDFVQTPEEAKARITKRQAELQYGPVGETKEEYRKVLQDTFTTHAHEPHTPNTAAQETEPMNNDRPFPNAPMMKEDFQRATDQEIQQFRENEKQKVREEIKKDRPQPTLTPNGSLRAEGEAYARHEARKAEALSIKNNQTVTASSHRQGPKVRDNLTQANVQLEQDFQQATTPPPPSQEPKR